MTAIAEARAMLDQLMGGDRDAKLPPGMSMPNRKRGNEGGEGLLLPGKRHKSCYDKDICPLYCAWGVDVYDLFVNTKSDIGPNPYKPDDSARKEYLGLPDHEKERLGFGHFLFVKLQELVQQCDRTVHRNNEKLNKELQRQLQKRGNTDYVHDIDEAAVDQLCRNELLVEDITNQLNEALQELIELKPKEDKLKSELEKESKKANEALDAKEESASTEGGDNKNDGDAKVKTEPESGEQKNSEEDGDQTSFAVKKEDDAMDAEATDPTTTSEEPDATKPETPDQSTADNPASNTNGPSAQSLELGKLTLQKQAILCDIARKLGELGPLHDMIETQLRNLSHVKSDITTDKTVCDVSGNFMSARDADERIAAHYAGKQYVGWKLVREKLKEMVSKHGKFGPPPPGRGPPPGQHPPPMRGGGGGNSGGGGYGGPDRRGGGGGGGGSRFNDNFRGGGGGHRGGGGGGGNRGDGRWDRGGGGGYDRGYDSRGGGGHDRGRRGGGGGGWGRR